MNRGAWRAAGPWGHKELYMTERLNNNMCLFSLQRRLKQPLCLIVHHLVIAPV